MTDMDKKVDFRCFSSDKAKKIPNFKKTIPHPEKVRQLLGVQNLFHPFCGASQSNEVSRSQNSRLLKKKKINVLHHYYSYQYPAHEVTGTEFQHLCCMDNSGTLADRFWWTLISFVMCCNATEQLLRELEQAGSSCQSFQGSILTPTDRRFSHNAN